MEKITDVKKKTVSDKLIKRMNEPTHKGTSNKILDILK